MDAYSHLARKSHYRQGFKAFLLGEMILSTF